MITYIRTKLAQRRLARLVAAKARSFETIQYRQRRAAALKGIALKRERAHG